MAGPSTREASPRGNASAGTSGYGGSVPTIVVLLALGLALRLIIAYVLLPGSGFPNDLSSFQGWSNQLAAHGPMGFYDQPGFLDYPPVYLLLLYLLGLVGSPLGGVGELVKLVPIATDLALACVVFSMAQELGASRRRALIAAAVILFNPITWFNSAIWGQADVVGSVFMLLGLRALLRDRRELAAAFAVVATLTKIQLGILGFLVGFVVLRRSLAPREGKADPERVLTSIAAGLGTAALICLPFTGIDLVGLTRRLATAPGELTLAAALLTGLGVFLWTRRVTLVDGVNRHAVAAAAALFTVVGFAGIVFDSIASHIINTFGEYPYLTLNAYNPWALVGDSTGAAMDQTLSWIHDAAGVEDSGASYPGFMVGPFSATIVTAAIALALLFVAVAFVAWLWAGSLDHEAEVEEGAGTAEGAAEGSAADAESSSASRKPTLSLPSELRAIAVGCLVVIGAVGCLFAGQFTGGLPAAIVGDGYLIAILVGVSIWAAWRDDRLSLVVALTILAIAFFVVPTRAHERYLFPFFTVGALLLAVSWRWSLAYVALAIVNTANLLAVLVQYQGIPQTDGSLGRLLIDWGSFLKSAEWPAGIIWPIALSGIVTGLALLWGLTQLRGRAVQVLAWEAARAGREPEPRAGASEGWAVHEASDVGPAVGVGDLVARVVAATSSATGDSIPGETHSYGSDDVYENGKPSPQPEFVPEWVMRGWRWINRPSLRPDRSVALASEPRGRFDKLDIWVVVALVAVILSMRIYRLGEPLQMHFDEVYHARTATEFLQDWRYNIPHDIYEWTHPHIAKYAIAGGLVVFSDDKVTATSQLGVSVKDAVVQPRITPSSPSLDTANNDPRTNPDARLGDRLYVATGDAVRAYDLQTRTLEAAYAIPGASSLSLAADTGYLYAGTSDGHVWRIDINSLDDVRLGLAKEPVKAAELAGQTGFPIVKLYAGSPPLILAVDATGTIASMDGTGKIVGRGTIEGAADFAPLGTSPATVSAIPSQVTDPSAEAKALASAAGVDPAEIEGLLRSGSSLGLEVPLPLGTLSQAVINSIDDLAQKGELPGIVVGTDDPQVLVAYTSGVGVMDARHVVVNSTVFTDQPATSIAINPNANQDSYVAAGDSVVLVKIDQTGTGSITKEGSQPLRKMPGPVTRVIFDGANKIVQALGRTPDGSGWTVYAIETNGNAVFSDAKLPWEPTAMGADVTPLLPNSDREELLVFAPDGQMAAVDIGQFAFAWRIVGVLFGALMAVCLYLLARLLFRRRSVGLLVAFFSCVDGMLFAQSRIAMNDTYVGGFLLLGYLLFAYLWLGGDKGGRRPWLAFWLGMPLLGLVLGLALASKWVALYAIASIGILILIRSALGRLITVLGMVAGTGVLGWMAISEMKPLPGTGDVSSMLVMAGLALGIVVAGAYLTINRARTTPDKVLFAAATAVPTVILLGLALTFYPAADQNGSPNYTFFLILLVSTAIAAAANAYHPIAWTKQETSFAVLAPIVAGILAGGAGLVLRSGTLERIGIAGVALGLLVAVAFWIGGIWGFGPLAPPPIADDPSSFAGPPAPAPQGWLRLGSGFGLPAVWMTGCLLVLPVVIYVGLYVPWAMPWQPQTPAAVQEYGRALPLIFCPDPDVDGNCVNGDGWPSGHTGKTLIQQTIDMYNYHNDLRATHAASSPWWAWPMDLKPVWFESITYGLDTGSMIYDGGNPVLWWLAITAMAFVCWQAFKRRSLGLALIAIAFLWQWLSWARVDRASFQYHFYTALPFFLLGLAYFVAELWHGPSRRTWLLARLGAAAMLLFPPVLWLAKYPLCGLARVNTGEYFGNLACGQTVGDFRVEWRIFLIAVVLVAALAVLAITLIRLERRATKESQEDRRWIFQLLGPVAVAGALLLWLGQNGPRTLMFEVPLPAEFVALALLGLFMVMALVAITARDPRRFALGICAAGGIAFLVLYPNLSALPMPNNITSMYNGLLPTWLYGFQFSVNLQAASSVSLISSSSALLTLGVLCVAVVAGYVAWGRRVINGYRRHQLLTAGPADSGEGEGAGAATGGTETGGPATGADGT